MARLTPLESAVLDAMAWELRDLVPDLAGQVEDSLPGLRRNTGAGLYSERIVDRHRPPPKSPAQRQVTGLFGTVHAMVGDLPDPIGFQVELRQGRLLALHGQSYGQDTRAIDFATAPFEDVFTVDPEGESIAYDPAGHMPESPLRRLQAEYDDPPQPVAPRPAAQAPEPKLTVLQRLQQEPTRETHAKTFGLPKEDELPPPPPAGTAGQVLMALYLLLVVGGVLMVFLLRFSFVFVLVAGGWILRWMHGKAGRAAIERIATALDQSGLFSKANRAPGSMGKVTSDTSHRSTPLSTRSRPARRARAVR